MRAERPHSLRRLLLWRLWLPLLALILLAAVASYGLARHYADTVYDRWLWDSAMSLSTLLEPDRGGVGIRMDPAIERMFTWDTADTIFSEVVTASGRRLSGNARIPAAPETDTSPQYYDALIEGRPVRVVQVSVPAEQASEAVRVRVAETLKKRELMARQLLLSSIPLQALVLLAAGGLIWIGVGAGARAANRAAQRLADDDALRRTPAEALASSPLELRPMVHALNDLMSRLSEAQEVQQRFVANAAHQLRTPLAALQVQLDMALREPDPNALRASLEGILGGLTRLHRLTHQILMLNRSEASPDGMLSMRRMDLVEVARESLERQAEAAIAREIDLGYDGPDGSAWVHGDAQLLRELIGNLLDNAIRYGAARGVVTLRIDAARRELCIDDDGLGIPFDERGRVLERFYRLPGSDGNGCGLGLAIVREIASRHGAALALEDAPEGGLRVRIRFPSVDPNAEARPMPRRGSRA